MTSGAGGETSEVSGVEQPIESSSPILTASSKAPLAQPLNAQRLNRQVNASVAEKNMDQIMFELETEDLELLESRVSELERYLGIENMDMHYFQTHQGEDLNRKAQVLEDFMRAAEDKYFCINDLFAKFEKMDTFLKHERPFTE